MLHFIRTAMLFLVRRFARKIRISCAGFIILLDEDGRYCLLINKNQLNRHGKRILTPIGGLIAVSPKGREFLRNIGAEGFEKGDDLRFQLPKIFCGRLKEWFSKRIDRELSPAREIEEELVEETEVLTMDDLVGMTLEFSGYGVQRGQSTRYSETNSIDTLRLAEMFTVKLSKEAMDKLAASNQGWVYFVTEGEIEAGVTVDGVKIADVCKTILRPKLDIMEC
ncbi:hypothetical protein [Shimazuella kribbensis]|uniref:SMODS-associated NUDIX domain-containing protein n=1 Tax=Shimazuella kribbensis TaxID=139808 RepID=UPI0004124319|nr:hypothetical protein [Shimazuella kribbensis]